MEIKYYYSLNELLEKAPVGSWSGLSAYWGVSFKITTQTGELYSYIDDRYGDDYVFILKIDVAPFEEIPERPTVEELKANYLSEVKRFLKKVSYWLDTTEFRYSKLIELYTNQESNLLNRIESVSTTQYNDTPQTTTIGLEEDKYASNVSKSTTSVDNGSVMARLTEIRNYYYSLYAEWAESFRERFVL